MLRLILLLVLIVGSGSICDAKEASAMSTKQRKKMAPWVLPENHPMKARLDAIFSASRVILDKETFRAAGFHTFTVQPRSYVRVATHENLPGYVVKVYFDNEKRLKRNVEGWRWFVKRCEGAKRLSRIIKTKKIKHFVVAKKWIYVLPASSKSPVGEEYSPKSEILIAEDMNIVSHRRSREAWKTVMTEKHLDELYWLVTYGKGGTFRPDNICYTREGKFAFIDTEYTDRESSLKMLSRYLSPEMGKYWKKLVDRGGPR